jgi:SpoVK/Ycf46/Vps4 family AAA+-type ATPase
LHRLDSFEGIAILTTSNGTSIDQAFKRRMSFRRSFPFPDEETREQLWRTHIPLELPVGDELTLDVLAPKYQLSGGCIRNACLRAAFLAAQEETTLHQRHLERAVALEFAELGKLSSGGTVD